MKSRLFSVAVLLFTSAPVWAAELPAPLVSGMKNPESVCLGPGGEMYVTEIGEFDKPGDGQVSVIKDGKAVPFATGLDDPKGIVFFDKSFYVTDKTKVLRINLEGKVTTLAAPEKFPKAPMFLNDIAVDPEKFQLYASDSGDLKGSGGAVYRIDIRSGRVTLVVDAAKLPGLHTPNGVTLDGSSHLLVLDFGSGILYRVKLSDSSVQKVAEGFEGGDGLTWDKFGKLFITSWKSGKVWGIPRPGQEPVLIHEGAEKGGFKQAADSCLDAAHKNLLIPDMEKGTLTAIPAAIPGWEVDETPLALGLETAFPKLQWTGWKAETESGKVVALRPILLTHAGDSSNRIFVPIQQGTIHVFANDDTVTATKVFLDISSRVRYLDRENEEGLLGMAFHPKFKQNGEFFVFYTDAKAKLTNVVSRFRVSRDDPNRADPASEEVIIRFEKPFWNHDGGTILFGPDGYLYIVHGDGGLGNDPHGNGQNLKTLLGKVLRIDVDHKEGGKNYAIPKDNPFVGKANAAPEIWAYGLRNVWRMAFDRKTGELWAGEVGQNLYEEIIHLKKGGNYGWNIREAFHPFSDKGVDVRSDLIEPIWEYHHDVGKSITGGLVYRGSKIPELQGAYLYADYVSLRMWALWYDPTQGRVVANREIPGFNTAVPSFGEDEQGEAYVLIHAPTANVIQRIIRK